MKKLKFLLLGLVFLTFKTQAQSKAVYAEIGGPGLASANFDMRFTKEENGFGGRIGVGGFSISDSYSRVGIFTIPAGINYLIGKDNKNYFEVGAGFTYIGGTAHDDTESENFGSSFGNLTFGYRLAPAKGGFMFKAQITPVFGRGFFIPYFAGLGFGYKF